jgi:glycosyltransferase involved in cell wall biosynthesis
LKILLATYWYIPHLGGVWPLMCQIKEGLESLGHEVDILGNCQDGSGYHIVNKNWIIKKDRLLPMLQATLYPKLSHVKNTDQKGKDLEADRYYMELAAAYFGLEQYDIIHTQDVISTRCLSRVKPKKTPLFASIHGAIAREVIQFYKFTNPKATIQEIKKTPYWRHYWALEQLGTNSADLIHTSTQWTKNILIKDNDVPENRIVTFPYGINIEKFLDKMNKQSDIVRPSEKKVIIYTGRLIQLKGVYLLIDALSKLKKIRNDWVCWIVGDGEMKSKLEKQSAHLGLNDHVKFLGRRDDVPTLLHRSDIFVLPSLQDNMPLSLIEAQIAGNAVVISNAGGMPEMVKDGQTGFVFPSGESDPLFHHLNNLLENDALRNTISFNIRQWALKYWSINTMTERLVTIYNELISNANAAK